MSAPQPERAKRYDTIDERSLPAKLAAPYALVDLRLMNEASIAAERLRAMFLKRKAKTPESAALWEGHCALRTVARSHAENVRKDGLLLFAAPDGKVMQLAMKGATARRAPRFIAVRDVHTSMPMVLCERNQGGVIWRPQAAARAVPLALSLADAVQLAPVLEFKGCKFRRVEAGIAAQGHDDGEEAFIGLAGFAERDEFDNDELLAAARNQGLAFFKGAHGDSEGCKADTVTQTAGSAA